MTLTSPPIGQPAIDALATITNPTTGYFFQGPSGVGKATSARWFIERFTQRPCASNPEVLWVEPTILHDKQLIPLSRAQRMGISGNAEIRVKQIAGIQEFLSMQSIFSPHKFVVIDGTDQMEEPASNALLKSLEEPGSNDSGNTGVFILIGKRELLPTVASRCQKVRFQRLSTQAIESVMSTLCPDLLDYPLLLKAGQGRPGKLLEMAKHFNAIPVDLKTQLNQASPQKPFPHDAFRLSKGIIDLDKDVQLTLLEFMQQSLWETGHNATAVQLIEDAIGQLQQNCHNALVWDMVLAELNRSPWQIDVPLTLFNLPVDPVAEDPTVVEMPPVRASKTTKSTRRKGEPQHDSTQGTIIDMPPTETDQSIAKRKGKKGAGKGEGKAVKEKSHSTITQIELI